MSHPHFGCFRVRGSVHCGVSHPMVHACPFLCSWGCPFRPPCTSMAVDHPLFSRTCSYTYSAIESNCSCAPVASTPFWPARRCKKALSLSPYSTPTGRIFCSSPVCDPSFSHAACCSRTWALCVCPESKVLLHLHQSAAPGFCGTVLIIAPFSSNWVLPNAMVYPPQYCVASQWCCLASYHSPPHCATAWLSMIQHEHSVEGVIGSTH